MIRLLLPSLFIGLLILGALSLESPATAQTATTWRLVQDEDEFGPVKRLQSTQGRFGDLVGRAELSCRPGAPYGNIRYSFVALEGTLRNAEGGYALRVAYGPQKLYGVSGSGGQARRISFEWIYEDRALEYQQDQDRAVRENARRMDRGMGTGGIMEGLTGLGSAVGASRMGLTACEMTTGHTCRTAESREDLESAATVTVRVLSGTAPTHVIIRPQSEPFRSFIRGCQ